MAGRNVGEVGRVPLACCKEGEAAVRPQRRGLNSSIGVQHQLVDGGVNVLHGCVDVACKGEESVRHVTVGASKAEGWKVCGEAKDVSG